MSCRTIRQCVRCKGRCNRSTICGRSCAYREFRGFDNKSMKGKVRGYPAGYRGQGRHSRAIRDFVLALTGWAASLGPQPFEQRMCGRGASGLLSGVRSLDKACKHSGPHSKNEAHAIAYRQEPPHWSGHQNRVASPAPENLIYCDEASERCRPQARLYSRFAPLPSCPQPQRFRQGTLAVSAP